MTVGVSLPIPLSASCRCDSKDLCVRVCVRVCVCARVVFGVCLLQAKGSAEFGNMIRFSSPCCDS